MKNQDEFVKEAQRFEHLRSVTNPETIKHQDHKWEDGAIVEERETVLNMANPFKRMNKRVS